MEDHTHCTINYCWRAVPACDTRYINRLVNVVTNPHPLAAATPTPPQPRPLEGAWCTHPLLDLRGTHTCTRTPTVGVTVSPRDPPASPMASVKNRRFATVNAAVLGGRQRPNVSRHPGSKVPPKTCTHRIKQKRRDFRAREADTQNCSTPRAREKTLEVLIFSVRRPVRLRGPRLRKVRPPPPGLRACAVAKNFVLRMVPKTTAGAYLNSCTHV